MNTTVVTKLKLLKKLLDASPFILVNYSFHGVNDNYSLHEIGRWSGWEFDFVDDERLKAIMEISNLLWKKANDANRETNKIK